MKKSNDISNNQPQGLSSLITTETFERFTYYGTRSTLLFYMYYSISSGGLNLSTSTAASIFSIFGSMVYLISVFGGYISDRFLGNQSTVSLGAILIIFGQIFLSIPFFNLYLLILSLIFLTFGTGLLKPTISSMIGNLYGKNDKRLDSGFTYLMSGINLGALLSPIIIGFIGTHINFHLGFLFGAISMIVGLLIYQKGKFKYINDDNIYPSNPIEPYDINNILIKSSICLIGVFLISLLMFELGSFNINNLITFISILIIIIPFLYFLFIFFSNKINTKEKHNLWIYLFLFISATMFWIIEEQGSTVFAMMANFNTNNNFHVNFYILEFMLFLIFSIFIFKNKLNIKRLLTCLSIFVFISICMYIFLNNLYIHIPSSWFQSINPLFILIYTPLFAMMWKKFHFSSIIKFSMGIGFAGLGCLFMLIPLIFLNSISNPIWILISIGIVSIGEMLISPIGLSVTNKLAPKYFKSQMMGMSYLSYASAQAINSQIIKYYYLSPATYFTILGIFGLSIGILLICIYFFIKK
ncbi:peptide MFS transporter [Apilactobacillus micheneri]|uniref:peptide MFS transporter n=1 Tax=Apilactobacillus micheneri TaxID=1899430 RepID=UPI000D5082F9|nr:oligopeptide:H+ symporter [Apilactobacillus micheneri]GAY80397.1 di-/tripeptide transporter [Apilactobacillus micheneri]